MNDAILLLGTLMVCASLVAAVAAVEEFVRKCGGRNYDDLPTMRM